MTHASAHPPRGIREPLGPETRRAARRIAVQTAALVTAVLIMVGAVVFVAVVSNQRRAATQALEVAVQTQRRGFDDDDNRQVNVLIVGVLHRGQLQASPTAPDGLPLPVVMAEVGRTGQPDRRTVVLDAGRYDVLTMVTGDRVVQAAYPLLEQHRERERILGAMTIAGGLGIVLAGLAGVWLSRRAVRPMGEALALQRRFVSDAGHELRTPLTLLSTRVQLLRRRVASSDARDGPRSERDAAIVADADGIVRDTVALGEVLEDLLTAADTRSPLPTDPVDVAAVAADAVQAATASAAGRDKGLSLTDDGPAVIEAGSVAAIKRAITALIDNALGHADNRVDVRVVSTRDGVDIVVADDGPGLSPDALPTLFDRFSGERRGGTGTATRHYGIGLSLVSEVAARHGGTVTAENRPAPDHGALFRLRLPRRPRPVRSRGRSGDHPR